MSTDEFQQIWKAYDVKLEKSLQLNLRLFQEVQSQKAKSVSPFVDRYRGCDRDRYWHLFIGAAGVAFWYVRTQPVMAVSFAVFIICTVIAIGMYIREIGVIRGISYGGQYCRYAAKAGRHSKLDHRDAEDLLGTACPSGRLFLSATSCCARGAGNSWRSRSLLSFS
jgi:hypothetical protein